MLLTASDPHPIFLHIVFFHNPVIPLSFRKFCRADPLEAGEGGHGAQHFLKKVLGERGETKSVLRLAGAQ